MSAEKQLHKQIQEIMRVSPILSLATVSSDGQPHSSTVWTAPSDDLTKVYWLSSPQRKHSEQITAQQNEGKPAKVSGALFTPQRPSRPVKGLSFEGYARQMTDPTEIKEGLDTLVKHRVFFPDEAANYLQPSEGSDVAAHGFYVADINEWTVFDGRKPYAKRLLRLILDPIKRFWHNREKTE